MNHTVDIVGTHQLIYHLDSLQMGQVYINHSNLTVRLLNWYSIPRPHVQDRVLFLPLEILDVRIGILEQSYWKCQPHKLFVDLAYVHYNTQYIFFLNNFYFIVSNQQLRLRRPRVTAQSSIPEQAVLVHWSFHLNQQNATMPTNCHQERWDLTHR